uniref:Retrovirus-related Pol polyprotein from transposon TNT 1-94-like beta-barrel domain-containing protein n=1 Tax=Nicotiana tabacum TaxID=4097 RepID=A0A1S4BKI4_TOBAC|nr:PREDICTED: uncharacterized protein LOC107809293 [Nicotiana tabacum]
MLYSAPMEKSGLVVSHEQPKAFTSDKDHMHCDYYRKPKHTKETCWKLHGRPTRDRGGKRVGPSRVQANFAENVETSGKTAFGEAFSLDEVQHLRCLLNKLDSSNVATSNYVQSGIAFNARLNSWIIDSGENRHMTGSSKGFKNYSPSSKGDYVRIANGSLTPASGTGSVVYTPDTTLSSVLHVPEFPVNLLSVSAITKKLNYSVEFFPDHYVFQNLQTTKRIGSGTLHDDLYWIDGIRDSSQAFFGGNKDVNQEIIRWHRELGQPSFFASKKLYPSLFYRIEFESLFCIACEFARHTRNSYYLSDNKSTTPFSTIHSDVWGPAQTVSSSGSR